ncbi:hypothetical protein I315_00575 [Cryptococcus gattii Ru294]|nr:hypothetical protein I315_00575 [Cryptococcus gattii Ru294]
MSSPDYLKTHSLPFRVYAEVLVQSGKGDEFEILMAKAATMIREEPGVIDYIASRGVDPARRDVFWCCETYQTAAAYEKHMSGTALDMLKASGLIKDMTFSFADDVASRAGHDNVVGRCNCGSITVKISSKLNFDDGMACFCANCRRASGGVGSVNLQLPASDFSVQDSQNTLKTYQDTDTESGNTASRSFCGTCGSPTHTISSAAPDMAFLKMALFDCLAGKDSPSVKATAFEQSKPQWLSMK